MPADVLCAIVQHQCSAPMRLRSTAAMRGVLIGGLMWTGLLVIAEAPAARGSFSASVTLIPSAAGPGYRLTGRVSSRRASCVGGRTVQLYFRSSRGPFFPKGSVRTSATGGWHLPGIVSRAGDYEVRVVSRHVKKGRCSEIRSAVLTLIRAAEPPSDPSVPLTCDPGYVTGRVPGGAEELCLPINWNGTYADCAIGAHVRPHYVDQCVFDGRPTVRR
jgi:hypothetical protein